MHSQIFGSFKCQITIMSCSSKEISSLSIQQVCSLESNNNHELQLQGNFFIKYTAGLFFGVKQQS